MTQTIHGNCPSKSIDILAIISDYSNTKSIWATGERLGLTGQRVHSILNRNGVSTARPKEFSQEQIEELKALYEGGFILGDGKLNAFCKKHGKDKPNVSRKARKLGLTNRRREFSDTIKAIVSKSRNDYYKTHEHPKGMLGKTHSDEFKKKASERSKKMWADPKSYLNSKEHRQNLSDRASISMRKRLDNSSANVYSKAINGHVTIGGKTFFARSSWEANIAAYFEFLKSKNEILEWVYEPKTFWFLKIKRGVRSYKPDFFITNMDGTTKYVEVKGWMDKRSATKLNRMKIYYPEVVVELLDAKRYTAISKMRGIIPNWGMLKEKQQKNYTNSDKPRIEFELKEVNL